MPWSKNNYPDAFKNANENVRKKAIEIANALLREGYEDGRAISIALSQAREYVDGDPNDRPHYEAKQKEEDWILKERGNDKAIFNERTKKTLLDKAKPYVNDHEGILSVYHADGSLEDTLYE